MIGPHSYMGNNGPNIAEGPPATVGPALTSSEWLSHPRRLKFQLGEVCIGSVLVPSLTLETHFMRLVGGPPEPVLPFDRFPRGIEAAIAGSYPVSQRLPRLSMRSGCIRNVSAQYNRYYIDLAGSFADYLGKFSSKSRSTLQKKVRKFAEFSGGEILWRVFGLEEIGQFHELAITLSRATYQARLLGSGLPETDRFQRELAGYSDARGYLLFHGDTPIAYIYCPARDGNLLYQFVGYDPQYEHWSPGTVLQYLALESLFSEGRFQTFDFTEGEGAHKEFFANRSVPCADIFYFRKSLGNLLIVSAHAGLNAASRGSAGLLDRLGLKTRIKKLIRSRA